MSGIVELRCDRLGTDLPHAFRTIYNWGMTPAGDSHADWYKVGVTLRREGVFLQPLRGRGRSNEAPGYVVDHIVPLSAGGADARENMRWHTWAESHKKDAQERRFCKSIGLSATPRPLHVDVDESW